MIWAQSCKNAVQTRFVQCLGGGKSGIDHELKFHGVVVHRVFASKVGSNGEADHNFDNDFRSHCKCVSYHEM